MSCLRVSVEIIATFFGTFSFFLQRTHLKNTSLHVYTVFKFLYPDNLTYHYDNFVFRAAKIADEETVSISDYSVRARKFPKNVSSREELKVSLLLN